MAGRPAGFSGHVELNDRERDLHCARAGGSVGCAAASWLRAISDVLLGADFVLRAVRGNAGAALCAGMFSRGDRACCSGFCAARIASAFFYWLVVSSQTANLCETFFSAV